VTPRTTLSIVFSVIQYLVSYGILCHCNIFIYGQVYKYCYPNLLEIYPNENDQNKVWYDWHPNKSLTEYFRPWTTNQLFQLLVN
jgi:hypothetical protein